MILDNELIPLFYKKVTGGNVFDFKLQPDGNLTYNIYSVYSYRMDDWGNINKQYITPQGFALDVHDLQVLEDGTYYIFGRDHITVDMSQIVPGGNPAATIIAHTIHHMDTNDNELWRWNSFDHYDILDVDEYINLTNPTIDWTHCNSIEITPDGNIIISTRNFNEITKISRQTGEIIWRLGGERNQFQFINDNRGFKRQHDARVLSNGNVALFDNGYTLVPQYSSYVEYEIDEQNFTATLIRRYSRNGSIYSQTRGGIQELQNGNILVSWDDVQLPFVSEINTGDTTEFEVKYSNHIHQYRSYKFSWKSKLFTLQYDSLNFGVVPVGQSHSIELKIHNRKAGIIIINDVFNRDSSFYVNESLPLIIAPNHFAEATVVFEPIESGKFSDKIFFRMASDTLVVAQQVYVKGETYPATEVQEENNIISFLLSQNFPNPFNPSTIIKYQIPAPALVSLKVYDVLGNEVAILVNEEKQAGEYSMEFSVNEFDLSSGIYFYQLKAGDDMLTKKMLLVK